MGSLPAPPFVGADATEPELPALPLRLSVFRRFAMFINAAPRTARRPCFSFPLSRDHVAPIRLSVLVVGTTDSLELDSYNYGSVNCRASSTWLASRHVPPFIATAILA